MSDSIDRRQFLQKIGSAALVIAGADLVSHLGVSGFAQQVEAASYKSKVAVSSGQNIFKMVSDVLNKLGGIKHFVKPGANVVIKPNGAWARTPEQAANTNPEVVDAIIKICKSAGAGSVSIYENPCNNYKVAFQMNGLEEVCRKNNIPLVAPSKNHYREVNIPNGKILKNAEIVGALMDADCYINVPVAKVHSAGVVTLSLKNQMGCVKDRGIWHRSGLHQTIADFATVLKPHLNILDATRMLMTRGPAGPGEVKVENKIASSTDMVALDAYGAKLLGIDPKNVGHIVKAYEAGIGQMSLSNISVM
jgi:uncharacterized protein (DUF362 family)